MSVRVTAATALLVIVPALELPSDRLPTVRLKPARSKVPPLTVRFVPLVRAPATPCTREPPLTVVVPDPSTTAEVALPRLLLPLDTTMLDATTVPWLMVVLPV